MRAQHDTQLGTGIGDGRSREDDVACALAAAHAPQVLMVAHVVRRVGRIRGIDMLWGCAALALVATLSCGDVPPTEPDPPRPTWVEVSPAAVELNLPGATEQLRAEVLDQTGQPMAGVAVTWASSDGIVATVNAQGLVTGAGNGRATITATAESAQGTAEITVNLDRAALVALYQATGGRDWVNNDNWLTSAPLRDWYGVQLNSNGEHVRSLSLPENNLTGPLPPELGNLSDLTELHLDRNSLTGTLPRELGNLAHLQVLSLPHNNLTGPLPPELGNLARLESLELRNNNVTGPIPRELGNLARLLWLYLGSNNVTGPIPPELGNLANLQVLSLISSSLTGPIPPQLGNLANLRELFLGSNNLTGTIPPELGNLANLERLGLSQNNFTGTIPPELGNIGSLNATYNRLTGCIPANIRPSSINPQWDGVELERCPDGGITAAGRKPRPRAAVRHRPRWGTKRLSWPGARRGGPRIAGAWNGYSSGPRQDTALPYCCERQRREGR